MAILMIFWWPINLLFIIWILQVDSFKLQCRPHANTTLSRFTGLIIVVNDVDTKEEFQVKGFLSIPFAQPPVGDLRLRKPVPLTSMPATSKKEVFRKACFQSKGSPFPWSFPPAFDSKFISEDCLTLNIWAPCGATPQRKKSVFFWIHGGGFTTGSSTRLKVHEGHVLAALGDVVVVTTNYRLGALGFWTNNTPDAPGNLGIWDVIEALKWVNEHIGAFGGDKDSVTIAGQGAGAVIVSLLSLTDYDLTRDLFKRQIVQSGSAMWTLMNDPNDVLYLSQKVAEAVGCANGLFTIDDHPNETANCMRNLTSDQLSLLDAEAATLPKNYRSLIHDALYTSFIPRWGDELFPVNPQKALLEGRFRFDELLIGNTAREGSFLVTTGRPEFLGFFGNESHEWSIHDAQRVMESIFYTYIARPEANLEYDTNLHKYFSIYDDTSPIEREADSRLFVADAIGDFLFVCPTVYYAEASRRYGVKVYYYDFRYKSQNYGPWARWMGPTHFDEVKYIFGRPLYEDSADTTYFAGLTYGTTVEERRLSRMMIKHWSNFVKYGKPDDDWPLYGNRSERFAYIDERQPINEDGPHGYNCKEWWNYIYPNIRSFLPDYRD